MKLIVTLLLLYYISTPEFYCKAAEKNNELDNTEAKEPVKNAIATPKSSKKITNGK